VCGLTLPRQPLPAPLLFQASALHPGHAGGVPARPGPARLAVEHPGRPALATPALGRVEPLTLQEHVEAGGEDSELAAMPESSSLFSPTEVEPSDAFWPVVKMEAMEFLLLAALNALIALVACWSVGAFPAKVYGTFWAYILPVHAAVSWAFVMVPLVLVGQSPMMGVEGLLLDTDLPERRMSFSLLYLVSATLFPASFLCMVLTPNHRTLGELLSGQEILQMPSYRVR
jgi:hypothetical protein